MYRILNSFIFIRSWRNELWQRAGALDSLLATIRLWVTPIVCAYMYLYELCVKSMKLCWLHLWYMYKMLLGTWIYVWYVTWSRMMLLHDYEVQKYDYEKWGNDMYTKNDENAKHAKMMMYCMLHSKGEYEKRMNWCIEHWHMIKALINCIL